MIYYIINNLKKMLFPNIKMVKNMSNFQLLLKKKGKLANLELKFNSLISQIKKDGLSPSPEIPKELNSLAFHFINFGGKLLNIGIEYNKDNKFDNSDVKNALNKLIKNLKEISKDIPSIPHNMNAPSNPIQEEKETNSSNEEIEKYYVNFETSNKDIEKLIVCAPSITLDELIKKFLGEIERKDLFDIEEKEMLFYYNGERINNKEKKSNKISEIFKKIDNPLILVFLV